MSDGAIARRYPADGMGKQAQPYGVTEIDVEMTRPAAAPLAHGRARRIFLRLPCFPG
ncbi:MAG: hypothetical protein QF554_05750 [Dehalococcoidia bacterium]|nr:hypothetical protein [Dehalococcoidia bacterium]